MSGFKIDLYACYYKLFLKSCGNNIALHEFGISVPIVC